MAQAPLDPLPEPAVVFDAGGESWDRVEPVLRERLAGLPRHGLLELLTSNAQVPARVRAWGRAHGYAVTRRGPAVLHVQPASDPRPQEIR